MHAWILLNSTKILLQRQIITFILNAQDVVDIFNNLLDENNREGWRVLQNVSLSCKSLLTITINAININFAYQNELVNGSEKLLSNAERYAKVVVTSASMRTAEDQSNQTRRTLSRTNLGNAVYLHDSKAKDLTSIR